MHNNILKNFTRPHAESYLFPTAAAFDPQASAAVSKLELEDFSTESTSDAAPEKGEKAQTPKPTVRQSPVDYAKLQAEAIIQDANRQAEEIRDRARQEAVAENERHFQLAREDGKRLGYTEGMAQAYEEAQRNYEQRAEELSREVQAFLTRAAAESDALLDSSVDSMKELSIAIAEKVVKVSLRSSSEIIAQMIQAAVDRRKKREWIHIYLSDTDAKRMMQIPPSLSKALGALSDRVKIIPMSDDEPGTCIIETPDEIIDASAATQLSNIKDILSDPTR